MSKEISEILLDEIRLNRKDIKALDTKLNKIDKQVFSNKLKLTVFISGVSLFSSIIIAVLIEKIKSMVI